MDLVRFQVYSVFAVLLVVLTLAKIPAAIALVIGIAFHMIASIILDRIDMKPAVQKRFFSTFHSKRDKPLIVFLLGTRVNSPSFFFSNLSTIATHPQMTMKQGSMPEGLLGETKFGHLFDKN